MAISVGPKGWIDLWASDVGPKRRIRVVSVITPSAPGDAYHPFVDPGMQPVAAINVKTGVNVLAYVTDTGTETGYVKFNDTGADIDRVGTAGDPVWVVYSDTGA